MLLGLDPHFEMRDEKVEELRQTAYEHKGEAKRYPGWVHMTKFRPSGGRHDHWYIGPTAHTVRSEEAIGRFYDNNCNPKKRTKAAQAGPAPKKKQAGPAPKRQAVPAQELHVVLADARLTTIDAGKS